jgi:hypothetical protein
LKCREGGREGEREGEREGGKKKNFTFRLDAVFVFE